MLNTVYIFFGTFLSLCGATALNKPTNVRLTSQNMDLVLRWDPPEGAAAGVRYTAVLSLTQNITDRHCVNVSSTWCDFTKQQISVYGYYTARVKALLGDQSSEWAASQRFTPDIDTIIGPPNVTLLSFGTTIEVVIVDPKFAMSTLESVYPEHTYNVTYWKQGEMEQATSLSSEPHNRVTLSDLEVSTRYCVQVRINTRNPHPSKTSRLVCESTGKRDRGPWVAAGATFFTVAGALALGVVALVYRTNISHFLCPRDALPSHLKEYLLHPPTSAGQLWNYNPPEEVFHQVSLLSLDRAGEGGRRPLLDGGASCTAGPQMAGQEGEEEEQEEEKQQEEEEQQEKEKQKEEQEEEKQEEEQER